MPVGEYLFYGIVSLIVVAIEYNDACTINLGDELFSDTYPMKVVDDVFYEVEGKVSKDSW
ncbi:MAG: translationally-controlled tumor protein [Proteobacteria bacterium]|nr:translationally-controlled tumor protein [Pseudomonadota bacterium]